MALRTFIRRLCFFLVPRYPFVNCLTLLMLLAERADRETTPFLEPKIIYVHLAIFLVTGVGMGFDFGRRRAAVAHAGQLLHLVYLLMTSERIGYRKWVQVRMASRLVGMSGMMLLYAFFTMPKPRSHQLRRIGEILFGVYLVCVTYMMVESPEDRKAFVTHMPGGEVTLYMYAMILAASALCFLPGLFVHDVTQACVILLFASTTLIDCDINYWVKRRGLDYWNHIRLLLDNVFIVISLAMYLSCTKRHSVSEQKVEEKED